MARTFRSFIVDIPEEWVNAFLAQRPYCRNPKTLQGHEAGRAGEELDSCSLTFPLLYWYMASQ